MRAPLKQKKNKRAKARVERYVSWRNAFDQGYVCAVATLVRAWGRTTEADYLLSCNTPDDWRSIDEFELLAK